MKKAFLTLLLLIGASCAYSQISKADAVAFLTKNPLTAESEFQVDDDIFEPKDIVSLKAAESGFTLISKDEQNQHEWFFSYSRVAKIYTWSYDDSKVQNIKIESH